MRKHLILTMLLLAGLAPCSATATATPEPQNQSQAVAVINGTVLDENDEAVIGASVAQKGVKGNAVATDAFGHFKIRVAAGTPLEISYVGYKTVTMPAAADMRVYLQPTTEVLNELVAIGYGNQKRANLTGAVSTVDVSRTMENRPEQDVLKALQGAVPGLTILNNTGNITGSPVIKVRGTGTLSNSATSNPLFVVDGVAMDDISYLNPEEIKEISVLKDASSSSIYGSRAAFGVILITTKSGEKSDRIQVKYSNNFGWSQAAVLPEIHNTVTSLEAMIEAAKQVNPNQGEFFSQWYTDMLPYAKKWQEQYGGIIDSYRELRPYVDENNVGDFKTSADGKSILSYANYNIQKIMLNNAAPSNSHNASISGSSGRTTFNIAFGYAKRQSLMNFNPDKVTRYNAKVDLKVDVTKWLVAGVRMLYSKRDVSYPNTGQNIWGHIWRFPGFYQMLGYSVVDGERYDYKNNIAYLKQADNVDMQNQFTRMQAYVAADILPGLKLNADFTYQVFNQNQSYAYLPVVGINNWNGPSKVYPMNLVTMASTTSTKNNTKEDRWSMNVYASYDKTFNKDHNFKVMVGANAERNVRSYFQARTKELLDVNLPALNLYTGDLVAPGNADSHWATAGFFGRINYDYKGIYLAEFNGRYDGSSRFPANDQWAFFSSGSVGYRFSEEGYFKPLKEWWSNGKLRASYGEIGNEAIGTNMFISTITNSNINYLNQVSGVLVNAAATPALVSSSLTWERICTTDVGLDLGFFDNSLTASFDWYQRDTKDMLAPGNQLPSVLGANAPYGNYGSLRTRGWELSLGWNHSFGDWDVYASFNLADARTKITKWNSENQLLSENYSGMEYGVIYGLETDRYYTKDDFERNADGSFVKDEDGHFITKPGVTNQKGIENKGFTYRPGDVMYKDQDGDGIISGGINGRIEWNGKIYDPGDAGYDKAVAAIDDEKENAKYLAVGSAKNHGDIVKIGNNLPRFEYGFHLGGAYKGFDLDIFCQGVGKRDMWTVSSMVVPFTQAANDLYYKGMESHNQIVFDENWNITDYIVNQGNRYPNLYPGGYEANNIPGLALNGTNNFIPQSRYLQDISYLRVKNITLGYTLPFDLTKKFYVQKFRVYFSGENLFFLHKGNDSGFDPEIVTTEWTGYAQAIGRANPIPRTYSFGFQITL